MFEALQRLAGQGSAEAQESLCRLVLEFDHPGAREVAVAAGYAPHGLHEQALFYFLTEQWDKWEELGFDQSMLRTAYETADERLRGRIATKARRAGRVDWVQVVTGGLRLRRLGDMTDEEWVAALTLLDRSNRWEEMWRLAQAAPAVWSARAMRRFKETGWAPENEGDKSGFVELAQLAERCVEDVPEMRSLTLEGHTDELRCLAISPDGQLLATGSCDHTVQLWRLPDGKALETLQGHIDSVNCLAISPEGRGLASGGGHKDHTVQLWRLPDGKALKTLEGHIDSINCLTISPDGRLLASGSWDNTVRLWTSDLARLSCLPVGQTALEDMEWVQEALQYEVPDAERGWLRFILVLMHWRRRFDIEVEEMPRRITVGEFDIEIEW